jgi:hypothetical protein
MSPTAFLNGKVTLHCGDSLSKRIGNGLRSIAA